MAESWKTEKFRKSVVDKINSELKAFKLEAENPGNKVEKAIYEKARSKRHYLGYTAKMILDIRRMICIQDTWLDNHVQEILTKPPPRLRRVLPASELAKYHIEIMRLKNRIDQEMKIESNFKM